jgi:hypothetical protein
MPFFRFAKNDTRRWWSFTASAVNSQTYRFKAIHYPAGSGPALFLLDESLMPV